MVKTYHLGLAMVTVGLVAVVTVVISVALANQNARDLVARYERDKAATAEANRAIYCALFGSQLKAFEDAQSDVGRESYRAWLNLYRLARCEPVK